MRVRIKTFITVSALLLAITSAYTQTNYTLNLEVKKLFEPYILIYPSFEFEKQVPDTIYKNGNQYTFRFPDDYIPGTYKILLDKTKHLDIIFNKENIHIRCEQYDPINTVEIVESNENKRLYSFLKKLIMLRKKTELIEEIYKLEEGNSKFKKTLAKKINKIENQEHSLYSEAIKESENTIFQKIVALSRPNYLPYKLKEEHIESYLLDNHFKEIDFNDSLMVFTEAYNKKVWEYFNLIDRTNKTKEEIEGKYKENAERLLANCSLNETVFNRTLNLLLYMFEESAYDELKLFLNEMAISNNSCFNEKAIKDLSLQTEQLKKLQTGKKIKDFHLAFDNEVIQFSKIESEYKLILFWASWCPYCLEELEELKHIFAKYDKATFNVIAISLDNSPMDFEFYISKYKLRWLNYCDYQSWDGEIAKQFYVNETPKMFLVNKDLTIVSKPDNAEQLDLSLRKLIK